MSRFLSACITRSQVRDDDDRSDLIYEGSSVLNGWLFACLQLSQFSWLADCGRRTFEVAICLGLVELFDSVWLFTCTDRIKRLEIL